MVENRRTHTNTLCVILNQIGERYDFIFVNDFVYENILEV